MKEVIPKKARKAKKKWMMVEILQKMDERKSLKGKVSQFNGNDKEIRYTHRKKVAYEEPFRVLQQGSNMEPLKVLQRTPIQGFFKELPSVVLQRTPKGTSENLRGSSVNP